MVRPGALRALPRAPLPALLAVVLPVTSLFSVASPFFHPALFYLPWAFYFCLLSSLFFHDLPALRFLCPSRANTASTQTFDLSQYLDVRRLDISIVNSCMTFPASDVQEKHYLIAPFSSLMVIQSSKLRDSSNDGILAGGTVRICVQTSRCSGQLVTESEQRKHRAG